MAIQGGIPPLNASAQSAKALTSLQSQNLEEILSKYNAEALSDDDAKVLVEEISDLGIQPGKGLAQALGAVGIDARALADQAGVERPEGKGPPGGGKGGSGAERSGSVDSAAVQTLQSIVELLAETDSDEDFTTMLLAQLEEAGLDTSSPIVDIRL